MRSTHAAIAGAALLCVGLAIMAGGRLVAVSGGETALPSIAEDGLAADEPAAAAVQQAASAPSVPAVQAPGSEAAKTLSASGPAPAPGLERIEPRAPLSELALASPPKPKLRHKAQAGEDGVTLFRPVASAAGVIEDKDGSVAIAGIDAVPLDETCVDESARKWGCGLRARGAFRAFLRGRAVVCDEPKPGDEDAAVACRIGKQDLGQWLVENGWARAAPDGPYAEAQAAAEKAKKGIFGAAPDLSGMQPEPEAVGTPVEAPGSILDLSGGQAMSPIGQPEPFQ